MKKLLFLMVISFVFNSCIEETKFSNSPKDNFEALWKIMDEHYCFFEYKGIDWNEVHNRYSARISEKMNEEQLFGVLSEMLAELKDGHVNLYSSFDVSRYWAWYEDFPSNFSSDIQKNYLKTDYQISSGIKYKVLSDNVGYMYYASFEEPIGDGNLDQIISKFSLCNGIIIDVRDNGGGNLTNVDLLAQRFNNERRLVGYIQHKTGKGHNDFSTPYPKYLETTGRLRYQKPVVVLTNRHCFSSANDFVSVIKQLPTVTIMGDITGGGSGLPISSELPNGWSVRFSSSPMFDANMTQTEFGIEPNVKVEMTNADITKGVDTIIEAARNLIAEKSKQPI
ncbi:MAG: S41 family peptidase [Bacteroidales bacterium]|nr:S41 family peptidase [Bacteroidales bacterium]